MTSENRKLLLWLSLFSLAFGYIEAAVVIYLRELHYPDGFHFPLAPIPARLVWTEVIREGATLLLLLSLAFVAARTALRRFAVFAFCFGGWDLIYYLTLKLHLDWPVSLLEWDVLFLIPLPWIGPVLAPILVSIALILAAMLILALPPEQPSPIRRVDWVVELTAGLIIILSFLWNFPALQGQTALTYYPWWMFAVGYVTGVGWFGWRILHHRKVTTASR
jgi:hypothetical protein